MAKADLSQLTGLMDLISGVTGGGETKQTTTSSKGKQTQQTQLSDAAVQEQIKNMLRAPGGVRDIGNAARKSGLYNSTSEELLLGNLYSTAAAQGELARAPTVTTSAPVTQTTTSGKEGTGIGTTLGVLAGTAALSKLFEMGSEGFGDAIGGIFGGGGSSATPGSNPLDAVATSFGVGPDSRIGMTASVNEGSGGPAVYQDMFQTQLGLSLPGVGDGSVGAANPGGTRRQQDSGFDLVGSVGSALSGFFGGGGLGGLVGAITGGGGSSRGAGGGGGGGNSIICTALMERGLLDEKHYAAGSKYIQQVSPVTKVGYYVWANRVAEKIRKGSGLATWMCLPFAAGRTALLASSGSLRDHLANPLGTLTKFVGEPICWIIGAVVVVAALHTNKQVSEGV